VDKANAYGPGKYACTIPVGRELNF
jgi:hypothetical protein